MLEFYAAADVSDLAFKSREFIASDLEARFGPALLHEIRGNLPRAVEYVAAEKTKKELADTMEQGFEHEVIKGDFHMVKIKVWVEADVVQG